MNNNIKREYDTYLVTDEELLYKLASYGLLGRLCRVAPNKYLEGVRIWFFDKDPEVGNVIRQYKSAKRAKETKNIGSDKY